MSEASPDRPTLVLVVDDEPLVRMLGTDVLEDAGFVVVEAGNAAEALQILEAHPEVSVLFTDVNMPGEMNGIDLAQRVNERRPDVRLLIASGQASPRRDELPDGSVFLRKPWDPEAVVERIRSMLEPRGD
jgi:CheY-like chemotaxis protein